MKINDKADFIRKFLQETDNLTRETYCEGWVDILDLHKNSNNLSYEFMLEVEKEIDSIYNMICEANKVKKEIRIPALHAKGMLHRCYLPSTQEYPPSTKYFFRVKDTTSEEGFTDYDVTHYDLEVMILDSSAEFIQNENGNFLDYTEEVLSPSA